MKRCWRCIDQRRRNMPVEGWIITGLIVAAIVVLIVHAQANKPPGKGKMGE